MHFYNKKKVEKSNIQQPMPARPYFSFALSSAAVSSSSVQILLFMRIDSHIGCRFCHARKHKALLDLAIVQEALVTLVHSSSLDLPGTRRACAGAARVRQVDPVLLRHIQDDRVLVDVEHMLFLFVSDERHFVALDPTHALARKPERLVHRHIRAPQIDSPQGRNRRHDAADGHHHQTGCC